MPGNPQVVDNLWTALSMAVIPVGIGPGAPRWVASVARPRRPRDDAVTPPMARRATRSISGPIIYGSVAVALSTALLVGWIYVIVRNQELTQQWAATNVSLLVAGIVSFLAIITVLVLFAVFLAREILEVRRQTTFVDSVTHELRSPLASLRLCLETLRRPELPAPQRDRLHDMMRHDVERLSGFIDDILEATRLGHGGRGHAAVSIDLLALVRRCTALVGRRHSSDSDSIKVDVPEDLHVISDPTALEIVIKNLLDNAVKYSEPPADVAIRAFVDGNVLRIEVSDHGIGIPKRELARVFDRFYRVDGEAVRARRGTGLGLFVVKALVRGLGGQLSAYSAGPGAGTRMTVVLPNPEIVERPIEPPAEAPPSDPAAKTPVPLP
jgi:signal transduction histidine kinase